METTIKPVETGSAAETAAAEKIGCGGGSCGCKKAEPVQEEHFSCCGGGCCVIEDWEK